MSGQSQGTAVDLANIRGNTGCDGGVPHGALLVGFVDAAMGSDDDGLVRLREAMRAALGDEATVDACAVIGAFNVVDRIADATGIALDAGVARASADLRQELGLERFASAANTPGA